MVKNWKKELARDVLALGSIPFYFIVFIRALIGEYMPFVYHLVFAFAVLVVLSNIFKDSNQHIARGFILVVFTSFFYKAWLYTVFVSLLWIGMVYSSLYLKAKAKEVVNGVIAGVISSAAGYLLALFL